MKSLIFFAVASSLPYAIAGHSSDRQLVRRATCGVKGYDKGDPIAYFYSTKKQDRTQAACGSLCSKDPNCNTFAISSSSCLLYTSDMCVFKTTIQLSLENSTDGCLQIHNLRSVVL